MCKPNGGAGMPDECPRRGNCRGCSVPLSVMAGEGIVARLDTLLMEERSLPVPIFSETRLGSRYPMPIPKREEPF